LHWEGPPTSRSYYQLTQTLLQRKSQSSSSLAADAQSSTTHPTPPASIPTAPNIIPRDWSASAFFYAWVANQENLEVFFPDLRQDGLQGDEAMPQLFSGLGVSTYFQDGGTLIKKSTIPIGVLTLNFSNHLDAVPAVVVALLLQERSATVVGIRNLQWKESNRLEALQQICQEIGASLIPVDVSEDRWVLNCQHVRWPDSLSLTTRHDHRLAMAFSILSTKIPHLTLDDTACVEKSFPSFWQQFNFHQKP
jgi:3-phosphoshikimate 1-carboxyvinyltransferase